MVILKKETAVLTAYKSVFLAAMTWFVIYVIFNIRVLFKIQFVFVGNSIFSIAKIIVNLVDINKAPLFARTILIIPAELINNLILRNSNVIVKLDILKKILDVTVVH